MQYPVKRWKTSDNNTLNYQRKLIRVVAQPSFKRFTVFQEDSIALESAKVELVLYKPVFLKFIMLDILSGLGKKKCFILRHIHFYLN